MQLQNKYKEAGVDIDAGNELVKRLKKICPEIGGFGGLYPLGDSYLVAGTDGVGTKLKLAFEQNRHDTIGIDLVAMCVNDVITTGATPLFFLDYFATSQLDIDQAEHVLKGIVRGCQEACCPLIGGETAEMPGFYQPGEYDLSGFCVGVVKKDELINGQTIQAGDKLIAIPSSGLHSNGFSLVRNILQTSANPGFDLLTPTRIYVDSIKKIKESYTIKGMAHITGGGLTENIPRVLPEGTGVVIYKGSWDTHPIFKWLQNEGDLSESEMYRTFNMGIGMVMILSEKEAIHLSEKNNEFMVIGDVINGKGVRYT